MKRLVTVYYSAMSNRHYCIYERVPGEYSVRYLKEKKWNLVRNQDGTRGVELGQLHIVDRVIRDWFTINDPAATKLNYSAETFPEPEKIVTPLLVTNQGRK